jgi:hypothetical protein
MRCPCRAHRLWALPIREPRLTHPTSPASKEWHGERSRQRRSCSYHHSISAITGASPRRGTLGSRSSAISRASAPTEPALIARPLVSDGLRAETEPVWASDCSGPVRSPQRNREGNSNRNDLTHLAHRLWCGGTHRSLVLHIRLPRLRRSCPSGWSSSASR